MITVKFPLVSVAEARDYLKLESSDLDSRVAAFIDYATSEIEIFTKRKLLSRTYDGGASPNEPVMKLSGRGKMEIAAREWPVTSISSIIARADDGVTTRALNLTGMRIILGGRRIVLPYDSFPCGIDNNIEVTCVAGYLSSLHLSEVTMLKSICLRWLQVAWQDRELSMGRGANFTTGGESVSLVGDAIPKDLRLKLRQFERLF